VAQRGVDLHEGSVALSAVTGEGIEQFLTVLADRLRAIGRVTELFVPYDRGDVVAAIHREGEVVSTAHEAAGLRIRARLADASVGRLSEYVVGGGRPDEA
jgi:GTP-binding protein HflX